MTKGFLADIAKYAPSHVLPAFVALVSLPILTHHFDPADYGRYILYLATLTVLGILSYAWTNSSTLRLLPQYEREGKLPQLINTYLLLSVLIPGLVALGFWLLIMQSELESDPFIEAALLTFLVNGMYFSWMTLLRARFKSGLYSIFTCWKSIVGTVIGLVMVVKWNYGIEAMFWGNTISTVIVFPFLLGSIFTRDTLVGMPVISRKVVVEMAAFGVPIAVVSLSTWALSLADRYLIEWLRGSDEVGLYSASYSITERTMNFVIAAFLMAEGPIAYKLWESEGIESSQKLRTSATRMYLIMGIPAGMGLCVLAKPLIELLTSEQYHEAWTIIPWIILGVFFLGVAHRYTAVFTLSKKTGINMYCVLAATALNIILNMILIPEYGYYAAAVATTISYIFMTALVVFISKRYMTWRFPTWTLARAGLCATAMAVPAYFIGHHLTDSVIVNVLSGVAVGVAVYGIALSVSGEVSSAEWKQVRQRIGLSS